MCLHSIHAVHADALFASTLQCSDELNVGLVRQAISVSLDTYGGAGCAGLVAQEFGDHPEAAAARMRWARATVAILGSQFVTGMRQTAAA
ncbi:MAG TPA: hypothetical protein VF060_04460 [Trebonia sp.]